MDIQHVLRAATAQDTSAIVALHAEAFRGPGEADAVRAVMARNGAALSLVAVIEDAVIGHILFTPVSIATAPPGLRAVGLAPLAVLPRFQYRGIGTHLARAGCEACAGLGFGAVLVLGAPRLYRRAGFEAALKFGLTSIWPGTSEAFQARELRPGALAGCAGLVRFAPEFDTL